MRSPTSPRRRRAAALVALAICLAGVVLPPRWLADSLVRADGDRLEQVLRGAWILKAALIALGGLALASLRPAREGAEVLVTRGVRRASLRWPLDVALAASLCLLALALRTHRLGEGLWFDEIDTLVRYARKPLADVVTTYDSQNNHLFYSVLARISVATLGDSAVALRLPAVLLGVASLLAVAAFGLRITDRREAFFAAALLAVSKHHVWFSQDARGYTGLLCFSVLASSGFLRVLTEPAGRARHHALGYGLWMALAIATHLTAVFVTVAHGLIWLALAIRSRERDLGANRWSPMWGFAFAGVLSLCAYALVLPQVLGTLGQPSFPGETVEWKNPLWLARETVGGLAQGLPGGWLALAAAGVVAAIGAWSYLRQSATVFAVLTLGALVTLAVIVAQGHNLWPRFFFFSAGFAVLIAMRGVVATVELAARGPLASRRASIATAAAALACVASAITVPRAWGPKQDFEGALRFIRAQGTPPEDVATLEMAHLPYEKLFAAGWTRVDNIREFLDFERDHPRARVVYTTPTHLMAAQPKIWERLQLEYDVLRVFHGTLRGGEVVVAARRVAER
jgi:hypothetical protein